MSAWDTIPSGVTITGAGGFDAATAGDGGSDTVWLNLPARTPVPLDNAHIGFAADPVVQPSEVNPACDGDYEHPTAPAGFVCMYVVTDGNVKNVVGLVSALPMQSFYAQYFPTTVTAGIDTYLYVTWAYTAP